MNTPSTRMAALDSASLKLHTAPDGTVWFADGTHAPIDSGMTVEQFVISLRDRAQPFIRILGTPSNALLAASIWPLCRSGGLLQVGSPAICENKDERNDPEIALFRSRQICLPPSLGGWHDFTLLDYPAYALVARIFKDNQVCPPALEILHHHPAWPALKFIPALSEYWAAWVLCFVIDPRWYINPQFPDRIGRLRSFMGLRPSTQRLMLKPGYSADTPATIRCQAVMNAWKNSQPRGTMWQEPGNFLWRIWRNSGGGPRGDLRASQKFLTFLRYTWLDALPRGTTSGGSDPLFLPDMLFCGSREIEAFNRHMSQYQNRV